MSTTARDLDFRHARGRWALLALVCALATLGSGCASKAKLKEPAKLIAIKAPQVDPVSTWSHTLGAGSDGYYAGLRLALEPDAVFGAELGGNVYAFDPKTGKRLWRTPTRARVISGPSVSGDLVLVGTLDGEVLALKRADGKQVWRGKASSEVLGTPVGAGDLVIAKAADGREYGLDARDGSLRWSFDRNVPNLTLRGISPPLVVGNRVYLGLDSGKLAALNVADGQPVWEQTISVPTGRSDLDRLTDIDADLVAGPQGIFVVTFGGDVALIDPTTGDSRWRRSVRSYSGMVLGGDKLFVTDADGVVWALDAETGAADWKQEELKYRRLSPPAYFKGRLVVGDYKGYLHWLSPDDGRIVARTRLGSDPITAPPAVNDDYVYVLGSDGDLAAYDVRPPGSGRLFGLLR